MGTAIHSVAENMTKLQKDGKEPTEDVALEILEKQWDTSSYRNQRTKENQDKDKSKEMIKTYLAWSEQNPNTPVDVEPKFKIILNDVTISGKIDRVEMTPDGEYEVIDFKTGYAYKTKNTIKDDVQATFPLEVFSIHVQGIRLGNRRAGAQVRRGNHIAHILVFRCLFQSSHFLPCPLKLAAVARPRVKIGERLKTLMVFLPVESHMFGQADFIPGIRAVHGRSEDQGTRRVEIPSAGSAPSASTYQ